MSESTVGFKLVEAKPQLTWKQFDLPVNVKRLHQFQTQHDVEGRAIRSVMIQKRKAMKCIEDEISQLVENKRGIEEDLVRLGVALAHHNHSLLPNEVLSHIFILLALGYGTVGFPIPKDNAPPQLVVSHVCSRWRRVALRTPELWSDTHLIFPTINRHVDHHHIRVCFHRRWVSRARTLPVTLSIKFSESLYSTELASALRNILLPIQVKRLSLCLTYKKFMALSTLPEAALTGLSECEVELTFPDYIRIGNISDPHPLITRLRSATLLGNGVGAWIPECPLPWSQLRSLKFEIYTRGLDDLIIGVLRQIPMLEALSLPIFSNDGWEQLTMPSLRNLTMRIFLDHKDSEVDSVLRSFMCPTLTQFKLMFDSSWTCETFEILKQQYNMQELRVAKINGNATFALPVSSLLHGAPMLHSLILQQNTAMDEEALIGVSNGTLGRLLRRLEICIRSDVGEVLDMVEARNKTADSLIKNGCSWREEITRLNDVVIHTDIGRTDSYKERIAALEEAGIHITVS
jgi:hypothetical protein